MEQSGWSALAKPDGREIGEFENEHAVPYALPRARQSSWLAMAVEIMQDRSHGFDDYDAFNRPAGLTLHLFA